MFNKTIYALSIGILIFGGLSLLDGRNAQADLGVATNPTGSEIDWKQCSPHCYEYIPNHNGENAQLEVQGNQDMNIVMANGSCNINGTFDQTTGTCSAHSIILSPLDYVQLTQNPSVMAVINIFATDLPENINYCSLATWTYSEQSDSFKQAFNSTIVIPNTCTTPITSVPDMSPSVALASFMIITLASIFISTRFRNKL